MDLRRAHTRFFNKLAHLYDAGVPLAEALEISGRDLPQTFRAAMHQVLDDIFRGTALADALARRPDLFGPDVVSVVRSGETRGELGAAARSIAAGLSGQVLDPVSAPDSEVERVLSLGRLLHVEPGGKVVVGEGPGRREADRAEAPALAAALVRRAGMGEGLGEGAFLWEDRLVRVSILPTPHGPSIALRISGPVPPPPPEAAVWRQGPPSLLVVAGPRRDDKDALLRSILRAAEGRRTAVGLPVPEAIPAPDIRAALGHDPDVLCLSRIEGAFAPGELYEAVNGGVWCVAGLDVADRRSARARLSAAGLGGLRLLLCGTAPDGGPDR